MVKHNAKFIRAALRGFATFVALGCFQIANAAYAELTPPTGYKSATAGATYAAQKTDIPSALERIVTKAEGPKIMLGRTEVRIPASIKYSPQARRVAAAVIFTNPYLRTAAGISSWIGLADIVWDAANSKWTIPDTSTPSSGKEYTARDFANVGWFPTAQAACSAINAIYSGMGRAWTITSVTEDYCFFNSGVRDSLSSRNSSCPAGSYVTSSGCSQTPPNADVNKEKFEDELSKKPMPPTVPLELPFPTDLPIDKSAIKVNPTAADSPQNQTHREATGDPVPVPNTEPVQYRKPYIDIVPSPTSANPWRVDIRPGESTSTDPKPIDDPDKPTDTEDKPTQDSDKSLCEKHPEILACAKVELDVPDGEIPKATKELTYTPEAFGGGSCPADLYSSVGGQTIKVYDWAQTCGVVTTYLRPIIILLGAMGALFILIPGRD